MNSFWEGFRIVDTGSLVVLLGMIYYWVRQFNKGLWHTDKEVQNMKDLYEQRIQDVKVNRDTLVADAQRRELESRETAKLSTEAAEIMRAQLTAVVGELTIVGKTMHAISPSASSEEG